MIIGKEISIIAIYMSYDEKEQDIILMDKAGYILDETGEREFSHKELIDLDDDSDFKPGIKYLYCIYKKQVSVSD